MSRKPRLLAIGLLMLALLVGNVPLAGANALVAAGEIAVVATTEGHLLSLREGPGLGFAILIGMGAGTEVEILRWPSLRRWYPLVSGDRWWPGRLVLGRLAGITDRC